MLVVGFDGSSASRRALAYALGMARREETDMVILEVRPIIVFGSPFGGMSGKLTCVADSESGSLSTQTVSALDDLLAERWRHEICEGWNVAATSCVRMQL